MKLSKISFLLTIGFLLMQTNTYAFRVYPTTAQNEKMFDKSNFPFIADNADGFNLQYDCFSPFSNSQVETIFNQFKNKNFINHGIYKEDVDIRNISTMNKKPSFANVTAFMLYNEAPAMDEKEWESALGQNVSWPLITHCRIYDERSRFDELRRQILATSGIMMEFQVTRPDKFDDAAKLMKFCVDNDRMVVFLTTFQRSPDIFISAYKEFYYYLKENLGDKYLSSDKVIFIPNTYDDSQVFPETLGYGSTFGVAHWLIDQKTKTKDGYIQPKINFTKVKDHDFFPNNSDITIQLDVTSGIAVSNIKLYMDGNLIGEDAEAPYSWSGGALNGPTTGYKEIKAVLSDVNGVETSKAMQIRILDDAISLPGFFKAGELIDYQLRSIPDSLGFIRHVYGKEWIDYKVNVKHAGLYDVKVDLKVQSSKQYGGTIILKSGSRILGSFTTITNDPDRDRLPGFTEHPEAIIRNVELSAGVQTIRASFSHPEGITKPQFYLYSFNFMKQGAPDIEITTPAKNEAGEFGSYDAPAAIEIAANVTSPRTEGKVKSVSLYMNDVLVNTLTEAPYSWNDSQANVEMSNLPGGDYKFKIVATDELGYVSFEEINLVVIARRPFNPNLTIPGTVKAWEFDLGGEGIGYHDFNEGMERGLGGAKNPRYAKAGDEDAEIEISAKEYCVSGIRSGEWLSYTISDVKKGVYDVILTTAANTGKSADVKVWLNNKVIASVHTEETGSDFNVFKNFKTSKVEIPEDMKNANIRIEFTHPTIRNYLCFFREFKFVKTAALSVPINEHAKNLVSIYPNPAKSYFTVSIPNLSGADILVRDITGKQVLKLSGVTNKTDIYKNQLSNAGTYFISVRTKKHGVITQKLIML